MFVQIVEAVAAHPAGPQVICGPGGNAGVVDIGDGPDGTRLAVIFKMESHNHPSCTEPYQGATTGMGGILATSSPWGRG